jgi:hypothetical protein
MVLLLECIPLFFKYLSFDTSQKEGKWFYDEEDVTNVYIVQVFNSSVQMVNKFYMEKNGTLYKSWKMRIFIYKIAK